MILSAVQVGGLVLVILIGLPGGMNLLAGHGTGGLLGAAALVFFAFIGFDEVITLAEETRIRPERCRARCSSPWGCRPPSTSRWRSRRERARSLRVGGHRGPGRRHGARAR